MSIDLSSFSKNSGGGLMQTYDDNQQLVVLVKTHTSERPKYLTVRTDISQQIFSAEIIACDLLRLEGDANIQSFSISQPIATVKVKI